MKNPNNQFYRTFYISAVCFFCLIFHKTFAQNQYYDFKFKQISSETSISNQSITKIAQDTMGFIWFGTQSGLNRYDGYNFEVFYNNPDDSTSIADNFVVCFYLDSKGRFWIGTNSGLSLFNSDKKNFKNYIHVPKDTNSTSSNYITKIVEDQKNNLWVGTSYGIKYFNVSKGTFTSYNQVDSTNSEHWRLRSLVDYHIYTLEIDKNDNLWIGTRSNGLFFYNTKSKQLQQYTHDANKNSLSSNSIRSLLLDKRNFLWIGTFSGGVNRLDIKKNVFTNYINHQDDATSVSGNFVTSIVLDKQERLWVATDNSGLALYDYSSDRFYNFYSSKYDKNKISSNKIWSLFSDKEDNLWIGHYRGGISFSSLGKLKSYNYYVKSPTTTNSISNDIVTSIVEDDNGNVWVGTDDGGLNFINNKTNKIKHYLHNPAQSNSLPDNSILSLFIDSRKRLWIGSYKAGLAYFKNNRFTSYQHDPNNKYSIAGNDIRQITEGKNGHLWLATHGIGITRFDIDKQRFYNYRQDLSNDSSLIADWTWCVYGDKQDNIWIGTTDGLSLLNKNGLSFTNFIPLENDSFSISHRNVFCLKEDSRNNLWIGTESGLNLLDRKTFKFKRFSISKGFSEDHINSILEDDNGNLYMGTNKGIIKFCTQKQEIIPLNISTEIDKLEFIKNAAYKTKDGKLYFGSQDGLVSFYPDNIKIDTKNIKTIITNFTLFNKPVPIADSLDQNSILYKDISYTKSITLSYDETDIEITFSALYYRDPGNCSYQYILQGVEDSWKTTQANVHSAAYNNLPSGKHIFKVKARNSDGVWSNHVRELEIIVTPPFWSTWWFRTIILLSIIITIILIYKLRTHNIRNRNENLALINRNLNKQIIVRKQAEEALRKSKEKYQNIYLNIQDIYFELDTTGTILELSPSIEGFSKYKKDELIGSSISLFFENNNNVMLNKLIELGQIQNYEIRFTDKDKSVYYGSVNAKVVKDLKSNPKKIVGTFRNITERKKLQDQLLQTQKMDSIGTLAGGIAHDFNNIITIINGFAEIALLKINKDHPAYKDIVAVCRAGERAEVLTSQILAFSRKQVFKPEVIDVNKTLINLDQMTRRLIGEDISIKMKLTDDSTLIKADPGQFEQIFVNLIVNARDAINAKTKRASEKKITIETSNVYLDNSFNDVEFNRQGNYVFFSVSDNGTGMSDRVKKKIFEPFFTTKEKNKGTGLGLATVYGMIKQNNGNISVYSELGIGSTFKVYWPATQSNVSAEKKNNDDSTILNGEEFVLLVEDDAEVRNFASTVLEKYGYNVEIAENGQQALEIAKQNKIKFDLVLSDVVMPGMNGKELADQLKNYLPDAKVLFVSGYTDDHILHSGELQENINFLHKPFTVKGLASKVRTVLDKN